MGMSAFYTGGATSESEQMKVFGLCLENGVNFIDTAQSYGNEEGENEVLVGKAIAGNRDKWFVASKCGIYYGEDGKFGFNANPDKAKAECYKTLERLGIDCLDLYYLHRQDGVTPVEDTVKAFKELIGEGKIKAYGLSEHTAEQIRRAHAVHPCTAVQLEWSLFARDMEAEVIPTCRELGIGIVAYSPLGRGFLTGAVKSRDDLAADDWRRSNYPPMSEENFPHNVKLVERVKDVAQKRGCTAGQVALAWVHAQGEDVFPIPGTKRIKYAEQNHAAFDIKLTPEDLEELNFEVKGNRFNNMDISL